ncbi:MAG: DUF4861 domain-containing protein [Candidatus Azobacteroides sp.]|nr:DUF4861 domain-containing protein [Candidatus Azobacteroides sp.]
MKKILYFILSSFLLFACGNDEKSVKISVTNDSPLERINEIIEISWADIKEKLGLTDSSVIVVLNDQQIPYQLITEGNNEPEKLIFPVNVQAGETVIYTVKSGDPEDFTVKTYGRFVPERKDDFAWENNKIAFRMYGPALLPIDGPSNGIDAWVKRTEEMIIDKWYKNDLAGVASYHIDHGEGLDGYKVGRTLGAGGMAPFVNDTLWLAENYVTQELLDQGPLRTSFRLTYKPFNVNGDSSVVETKIISLDADSYFNKVIEKYQGIKAAIPVAAGIVLKTNEAKPVDKTEDADPAYKAVLQPEKGYVIYAETADKAAPEHDNGIIYTAVIFPTPLKEAKLAEKHALAIVDYQPEESLVYYNGVGWSKAGFNSEEEWVTYVDQFAEKLRSPLKVSLK